MDNKVEPVNEWILGPASRAFQLVIEEIRLAALTERATYSLVHLPNLLGFIKTQSRHSIFQKFKPLERLLETSQGDATFAKQEVESDFSRLHIHSLISIWSFIEACLEDSSVALIRKCDKTALDPQSILANQVERLPIGDEQSARKLQKKLFNTLKKQYESNYISTNEIFFKEFGINLENDSKLLTKMQEINSLRNCLLHRSMIIDEYALSLSPELPFKQGDPINITTDQFKLYIAAAGEYTRNFLSTILRSKYMQATT